MTEAAHLTETNRFLAPMDQTHTLTGGVTYRDGGRGVWLGSTMSTGAARQWGMAGLATFTPLASRPMKTCQRQGSPPACPGTSQ